ncbi:MAG: hypothetical protein V4490_06420 [Pseudomonadota bacterium]
MRKDEKDTKQGAAQGSSTSTPGISLGYMEINGAPIVCMAADEATNRSIMTWLATGKFPPSQPANGNAAQASPDAAKSPSTPKGPR